MANHEAQAWDFMLRLCSDIRCGVEFARVFGLARGFHVHMAMACQDELACRLRSPADQY